MLDRLFLERAKVDGLGKMKIGRLFVPTLLALAAVLPTQLGGQRSRLVAQDEEAMRTMTVALIKAPVDANADAAKANLNEVFGAGIIVAVKDNRTYIVTACHVVDDLLGERKRIVVEFYDRRFFYADVESRTYRKGCANLKEADPDDWSVVSVLAKPTEQLPFHNIGRAKPGYDVYVVGHPENGMWQISGRPGIVTSLENSVIRFDSVLVLSGNSGGPVLANNLRLLVGMQMSKGSGQVNYALDVSYIRQRLQDNNLPCDLGSALSDNPLADLK